MVLSIEVLSRYLLKLSTSGSSGILTVSIENLGKRGILVVLKQGNSNIAPDAVNVILTI